VTMLYLFFKKFILYSNHLINMFHGLIISPGLFVSAVQGDYVMSHLLLLFQALGTDIM
jgi:hypothetical protein